MTSADLLNRALELGAQIFLMLLTVWGIIWIVNELKSL